MNLKRLAREGMNVLSQAITIITTILIAILITSTTIVIITITILTIRLTILHQVWIWGASLCFQCELQSAFEHRDLRRCPKVVVHIGITEKKMETTGIT